MGMLCKSVLGETLSCDRYADERSLNIVGMLRAVVVLPWCLQPKWTDTHG